MNISIAVILFQIGIFLIMTYAISNGIWYLNILTVIIIIFTLANVATSPLLILQFFTVITSYGFCLNRIEANKYPIAPRQKHSIELILIILLNITILSLIIYGWGRFTISYFGSYENWGEQWFLNTLGVITYIIMLGFAFVIASLRFFHLKKTTEALFSKF